MTKRFASARNERGSVLLLSLVLIFVMTMLGLALFDLSVVEGRLVYVSHGDARAFEIAQAGVERSVGNLQVTYNGDKTWATGTALCTGGSHRGCSDSQFYPAASSYLSALNFDGGSYAVEFKQVTASTLPIVCQDSGETSDVDPLRKICKDLMFVRVTGVLPNGAPGYSSTRTVQLLVQAVQTPGTCLICGGLTGAAGTGLPIGGNVNIAGSILITGIDGTASINMNGGAGQTNSYAALDAQSLARVPKLPLVCPFGTTCTLASQLVESLGATTKIARPVDVPAVVLGGGVKLGLSGTQTYTADATRKG